MEETILVTGGAGFIGFNFILHWLSKTSQKVVNLDLLTYAANTASLSLVESNPKHIFIQGDIADNHLVASLLAKYKPRAIVHFAAESHVDRAINDSSSFINTNIVGTYSLLEACRGYWSNLSLSDKNLFRFLYISTDEVYGSLEGRDNSFTEDSCYQPNNPYSATKAGADHLVNAWFYTFGLPTIITHCSNNYGPYQHAEKLIPHIITSAIAGRNLTVQGDGKSVRDWIHVADHCSAITHVLNKGVPGESYNIGANNERCVLDVVNVLCDILDRLHPNKKGLSSYSQMISFIEDRIGNDARYAITASKIRSKLNWLPKKDFKIGLEDTVKWYLQNHIVGLL